MYYKMPKLTCRWYAGSNRSRYSAKLWPSRNGVKYMKDCTDTMKHPTYPFTQSALDTGLHFLQCFVVAWAILWAMLHRFINVPQRATNEVYCTDPLLSHICAVRLSPLWPTAHDCSHHYAECNKGLRRCCHRNNEWAHMHARSAHEFCATLLYSEDNSAFEVPSQMHRKNAILHSVAHSSCFYSYRKLRYTYIIICMSANSCAIYTLVTNRVWHR